MEKKYDNQVDKYVIETHSLELDGPIPTDLKKVRELENGYTLCESGGYFYCVKNYKQSNQQTFVVCDILED